MSSPRPDIEAAIGLLCPLHEGDSGVLAAFACGQERVPSSHGNSAIYGGSYGWPTQAGSAIEAAIRKYGLTPIARVIGGATAGVAPRIMGMGPAPATRKLCARLGIEPSEFDLVELNEAFASQGIAVLRDLGIPEDASHVNPNGGAIALGHPLGMSGARITGTAALELKERGGQAGARHHVHRCRPGHRHRARKCMSIDYQG